MMQDRSTLNSKVVNLSEWVDFEQNFHDEGFFQAALGIERKRSERSGRPFLLMLIDIKKPIHSKSGKSIFRKLVAQLNSHTRETDIKGWHTHKSIIGVIFTEIGDEQEKEFILERITQRVQNNLFYVIESKYFHEMKLSLQWFPDEGNGEGNNYEPDPLFYPDVIEKAIHKVFSLAIKRIFDIIGSTVAFIVFSPLFFAIPVLIKMTSKGPVFFRQERLGMFGKKFTFLKFRSMHVETDDGIHREYIKDLITSGNGESGKGDKPGENGLYKIQSDPRVTFIGKFLRKTSLDELPQFINVLRGNMSLVGPRPPIPYEYDEYKIWHTRRVIEVKPGITGLWQVEGRSSTSFDEMVRLDLKYVREWSLWMDIKIILKTPWVVLTGKGAY